MTHENAILDDHEAIIPTDPEVARLRAEILDLIERQPWGQAAEVRAV